MVYIVTDRLTNDSWVYIDSDDRPLNEVKQDIWSSLTDEPFRKNKLKLVELKPVNKKLFNLVAKINFS